MLNQGLRPVERRIRQGLQSGISADELARRFRRTPEWVQRVNQWSGLPRMPGTEAAIRVLRPLEQRVLSWRDAGADHDDIGARFHRSGEFIAQVERLARYKLGRNPSG